MPSLRSRTYRKLIVTTLWLASVTPVARPSFAEDKVQDIYTFSETSIKDSQNKVLPGSVANDRKVFLGSIGSDLWHGPQDARDEFWMITDRAEWADQSRRNQSAYLLGAGIQPDDIENKNRSETDPNFGSLTNRRPVGPARDRTAESQRCR